MNHRAQGRDQLICAIKNPGILELEGQLHKKFSFACIYVMVRLKGREGRGKGV